MWVCTNIDDQVANGTMQRRVVMRIFAFEQNLIRSVDQRGVVGKSWETVYKSGREVSCILEKRIEPGNRIEKLYVRSIYMAIEKILFPRMHSSYRHRTNFLNRFERYAVSLLSSFYLVLCRYTYVTMAFNWWRSSDVKSIPTWHLYR